MRIELRSYLFKGYPHYADSRRDYRTAQVAFGPTAIQVTDYRQLVYPELLAV
jgi:hypothetical protein